MFATALSAMLFGLEAHLVAVEVAAARGVPSFALVGLAEAAVRESRVRVRAALGGVGVDISEWNVVANLAPADMRKAGTGFDLALAVATAAATGAAPASGLHGLLLLGELSINGEVVGVRGVLPQLLSARARGVTRAVVPRANAAEAGLIDGIDVRSAGTLSEVLAALTGAAPLPVIERSSIGDGFEGIDDLVDVRGQASARRALEIAAAGSHNLLFVGPPGAGKTMLARRLPGILPPLQPEEALEVTVLHSVAGALVGRGRWTSARPFRAPHHTASEAALVGGGDPPRPGEISLAHRGVLFLDELGEFRRTTLEVLRQPLEDGFVSISRAREKTVFPSQPMLVCATNACPCGYHGDATDRCGCSRERIWAYQSRFSGPIVDRLDVHVQLGAVRIAELQGARAGESTAVVRSRVLAARAIQTDRVARGQVTSISNAGLTVSELLVVAQLDAESTRLLADAAAAYCLSGRAYGKVLRLARTIADLDGAADITADHVSEAVQLRYLDRGVRVGTAA